MRFMEFFIKNPPKKPESKKLLVAWALLFFIIGGIGLLGWIIGFSLGWLTVFILIWLSFLWIVVQFTRGRVTMESLGICFIIAVVGMGTFYGSEKISQKAETLAGNQTPLVHQTSPAPSTKKTPKDCKALVEKYDGKIFAITSNGKFKGRAALKIDHETCAYEITWQSVFTAPSIIKNHEGMPLANYYYLANYIFPHEGGNPLDGSISPVFKNKDALPEDAFNIRHPYHYYATDEVIQGTMGISTTTFSHVMQQTGIFSEETLNEIRGVKKMEIYAHQENSGFPNEAVKQNKPVATFHLTVSKKPS